MTSVRTTGGLPVAKHLRPELPEGAAPDLVMVFFRSEDCGQRRRWFGPHYATQVIPLADVDGLPIEGEA